MMIVIISLLKLGHIFHLVFEKYEKITRRGAQILIEKTNNNMIIRTITEHIILFRCTSIDFYFSDLEKVNLLDKTKFDKNTKIDEQLHFNKLTSFLMELKFTCKCVYLTNVNNCL